MEYLLQIDKIEEDYEKDDGEVYARLSCAVKGKMRNESYQIFEPITHFEDLQVLYFPNDIVKSSFFEQDYIVFDFEDEI